jgi:hypothetical protein
VVFDEYALAFCGVAADGSGGDGFFSMVGAYACDAVAGGASDGGGWAFVSGAV